MIRAKVLCGFVLIFLLLNGAAALNVTLDTNKTWVVAGGTDRATITAEVSNVTGSVQVNIWSDDLTMGTITPTGYQIAPGNKVTATFIPSTKSGDAVIRARAIDGSSVAANATLIEKVDHAEPKRWSMVAYPPSALVNTVVTITVRLNDTYNNIVENRSIAENHIVTFRGPDGGSAGFWDGTGYSSLISVPVGANGNATVQYRMDSIAGSNVILITAPPTVISSQQWITIKGTPGVPATIQSTMAPAGGQIRANNIDTFTITYVVMDGLGNPVPNTAFWRNTSLNEHDRFITNDEGKVISIYGPKSSAAVIDITATVEGRPTINVTNQVEFIHGDPVMWEFLANPQIMASRDVNPSITTEVMAKVMDALGNPVPGIPIEFSIIDTTNTTRLTAFPELVSSSALTDADGFAIVRLRPGAFPLPTDGGYNQTATGSVTVRALWGYKTKDTVITFKNYAYLRVETNINPSTVAVNDTVNVRIRLIGDGWGLQPTPINAVLATDRSGSMMYDNPDRMTAIMAAMKTFIGSMHFPRDRIGIVSFGMNGLARATTYTPSGWPQTGPGRDETSSDDTNYINLYYPGTPADGRGRHTYSDYATRDIALSANPLNINTTINTLIPYSGTPMRSAIYKAINEIKTNGSLNATRAIVLLSDGDYNWYGDPLARDSSRGQTWGAESFTDLDTDWFRFSGLSGSEQNLSQYAKNNHIEIYSIAFGSDLTVGGRETLRILAESTNGTYYTASATNIADVYLDIAGKLERKAAATDTRMNLVYQNLNVSYNNITSLIPGDQVFTYQYVPGVSTHVTSWNETGILPDHVPLPAYPNVTPSVGVYPTGYTMYPYSYNQSSDWTASPPHLYFDVGNISINQTWETIFQLKALTPGSICMFGPGSLITFKGEDVMNTLTVGEDCVGVTNQTFQDDTQAVVDIKDLHVINYAGPENATDYLTIEWTLYYNTTTLTNQVKQDVYYQFSSDNVVWSNDWIYSSSSLTPPGPQLNRIFNRSIDVRYRTGYYLIRVVAKENIEGGAYDEEQTTDPIYVKMMSGYIRIE